MSKVDYAKVEDAANIAVFHMQLPTREAIRYIRAESGCSDKEARDAVSSVVVYYKNKA